MRILFKILYHAYRLYFGVRSWTLRRFTRPGIAVLVGVILTAIMGPDTENNVTYQAFSVLFVLLLFAFAASLFFKARVSATRILPRLATAGLPVSYSVVLRNLTARAQRGLTLLENVEGATPSFPVWLSAQLATEKRYRSFRFGQQNRINPFRMAVVSEMAPPPLLPGQQVEIAGQVTPHRRGVLRFNGFTLARTDPLGLFRSFILLRAPQSLLVLPRRYPLPPIALPGVIKYQDGGVALASNVGQSDEFVALRDYRRGDPLRHIHWRSWAKTGKPVVREFEDEFFVRHALVLDTFINADHSDLFEEAVSVAASFACTIRTQESLLDLLFVGPESYCFTAGRGLAHAGQMLEILASVNPCRKSQFSSLEHLVLNHVKCVSGCVCVLLAWDEPRRQFIQKLQSLNVPALVMVVVEAGGAAAHKVEAASATSGKIHVLECGRISEGLAKIA